MDVILTLCDDWFLDNFYAKVLPHPPQPAVLAQLANSVSSSSTSFNASLPSYSDALSLDPLAPATSLLSRDSMLRQCLSLYAIALVGALILYYVFCSLSYFFLFDKRLQHHPRFLPGQIKMEIKSSMIAAPWIDLFTLPWFLAEVRGKSKLYEGVRTYGWLYLVASALIYLVFTDFCIYWVHRLEHHPRLYKHLHKPHHKWISESYSFKPAGHLAQQKLSSPCSSCLISMGSIDR